MQHTWQRRRARGSLYTAAGGFICVFALAVATTSPSSAEGPRNERSRRYQAPTAAKGSEWTIASRSDALLRASYGRKTAADNGELDAQPPGSVASPTGSTYSVEHRVGAIIDDGGGPQQVCSGIGSSSDPTDYIVFFDGVIESLREDDSGTVAMVIESDTPQVDGSRLIVIRTSAPTGTDLFPGNILIGATTGTDACFAIGLDDALDWDGFDTVVQADIAFLTDDVIQETMDVTAQFGTPWNGVVEVILAGGAGLGYNGVRLQIKTSKSFAGGNDQCEDRREIFVDTPLTFSTIGATKDGLVAFPECDFNFFADIEADIWFSHVASCTGDLIVDLCGSAYDTKVAVYDGCGPCPPENPIACNDDWCGVKSSLGPDFGREPVAVVQGSCYTIRVGGVQGLAGSGNGRMTVECRDASDIAAACCLAGGCTSKRQSECDAGQGTWFGDETCATFSCPVDPPSNDDCIDAIPLDTGVAFDGTTVDSTGTDISSCAVNDSNDVWHSWVADCSGFPTFETCGSAFDTTLSIFDGCDGNELRCRDDGGCPFSGLASRIEDLEVTEGQTYYVRVSGLGGDTGSYRVLVTGCIYACCISKPSPACGPATPAFCESLGGVSLIGKECEGNNEEGVDFACAECPAEPSISNSDPPTGALDARRPYDQTTPLAREGIGTAAEPVLLLLNPSTDGLEDCFLLSETAADPDLGINGIASVVRLLNGLYLMELDHAIAAGETTTIEYIGDGSSICVLSHPGNVNADSTANWVDVISLMDCCLENICTPAWAHRSCDIDRSGSQTPLDILTTIDLLLGSETWDTWNGTPRPSSAGCP